MEKTEGQDTLGCDWMMFGGGHCVVIDATNHPVSADDDNTADGTSLGADNCVGVAYILALLGSTDIPHPPLEAVLTVMEEKGKVGEANCDTTKLTGTHMIDFNWITDDQILAGCGGDLPLAIDLPAAPDPTPEDYIGKQIAIRGLHGGHCEFDIHLERANAIVALARILARVSGRFDVRIAELSCGVQNNVIPADAPATVMLDPRDAATFDQEVAATAQTLKDEFACADPDLRVDVHDHPRTDTSRPVSATSAVAWLGILIPNGVVSWSLVTPGIVESSNNLGTLRLDDAGIHLMTTITAGVTSRKHHITEQITALADLVGGTASEFGLDAPEFPYNAESELLRRAREAFTDVIGTEPTTLVANCSLELGMFTNRLSGLDTISIGTNLSGLHSPAERVSHRSIARVWPVVKTLMGKLDS